MPEVTPLPPELSRSVSALARSLVAAARTRTLYPSDHPAVLAAVERFGKAIHEAGKHQMFSFGVTPDTLLLQGAPAAAAEGAVAEAAAWLHRRNILELSFSPDPPLSAVHSFLSLLSEDAEAVRRRGGPATVWQTEGHPSIQIGQIDFSKLFEDREGGSAIRRNDDLWRTIVRSVIERRGAIDGRLQKRLLEIAGDTSAIADLAADVMAPNCTPDGSPLLTSQAAAVIATYRHLVGVIDVMAPQRKAEVLHNLACATARLDSRVVKQILAAVDEGAIGAAGAAAEFELRRAVEDLLLSHNDQPFVSPQYRSGLDQVGARAEAMAGTDIPPELARLVESLDQDNVRRLSVTLLIDLLALEPDAARAAELARDAAVLGEDLLLAGDYDSALAVARSLAAHAADPTQAASAGARLALDGLVNTAAFHEAVDYLGDMDADAAAVFAGICDAVGPAATDALRRHLESEPLTAGRRRAAQAITGYGARAVSRLAPLVGSSNWFVQRNTAELLGEIAAPEAVALLQPLLRGSDARVTQAAVRALSNIKDPSAARSVHTVLRAAAGELRRAVIEALVAERDPRVVPLLGQILDESDALGADHSIVLETLGAVGLLGGDQAVPAVDRVMRTTTWFARRRVRAVKTASLATLRQVGTLAAVTAVSKARTDGDRLLKRLARTTETLK